MRSYKCLSQQEFSTGNFTLIPIRDEDKYAILEIRNEQIYHLRQAKPLTKEAQDNYFATTVAALFEEEKPNQILFSLLKDNEFVGYGGLVHINWMDKNAEISFVMKTALEHDFFHDYWGVYLDLIERAAFDSLQLHKIFIYAFDLRPKLYEAVETKKYKKEAVLKEHCFFEGNYIDVIIHSKINSI